MILWNGNKECTVLNQKIKWAENTFVLKEGTPVDAGGNVSNDGSAIGVVFTNVLWPCDYVQILIEGYADLAACEAGYGSTISDAAKNAMVGIAFWDNTTGAFYSSAASAADEALADAKEYADAAVAAPKDAIILNSSTASSTKKFTITVDDDGEISATEVTE